MKAKTSFTLKVVLLTLTLIGGLSLALMMGVMMSVDEVMDLQRAFLLLFGLLITVFSFIYLIKANRVEEKRRVDETVNESYEYIGQWVISSKQWSAFLAEKLTWQQRDAKNWGWTLGATLGVITALIAFQNYEVIKAVIISISVFAIGFIVGLLGARKVARNNFNRDRQFSCGEVYFAEHLMVFNGRLIQVKDFGVRPVAISLERQFGQLVLALKIQVGLGNRKSVKQHWVAVPEDHKQLAEEMCTHYQSLI